MTKDLTNICWEKWAICLHCGCVTKLTWKLRVVKAYTLADDCIGNTGSCIIGVSVSNKIY